MSQERRILVVGSDAAVKAHVRYTPAFRGIDVDMTADIEFGIQRILGGECELVIVDLDTVKSGVKEILEAAGQRDIPVIVLTAEWMLDLSGLGLEAVLMEKPPEPADLEMIVDHFLREARAARAD